VLEKEKKKSLVSECQTTIFCVYLANPSYRMASSEFWNLWFLISNKIREGTKGRGGTFSWKEVNLGSSLIQEDKHFCT
jgi:hypothetical protein